MYTFLIQLIDNEIIHDFAFELKEAIKYHKWYYKEKCAYQYVLTNNFKSGEKCIPVGTVEFVLSYLEKVYKIKNIKPLNIPTALVKDIYLKREVWIKNHDKAVLNNSNNSVFIKNNEIIKGCTDIIDKYGSIPEGQWLVSELINIDSEWRIFVYNHEIVGCHFYIGTTTMFPDIQLIESMIKDFNYNYPYTLDVGISKEKGTFLIECHDFFSCGLYGFNNYKILPSMFIQTFNMLKKKYK